MQAIVQWVLMKGFNNKKVVKSGPGAHILLPPYTTWNVDHLMWFPTTTFAKILQSQ